MRSPILAFVSLALLAACSEEAPKPVAATGGTFIFVAPGDADALFPPLISEENGAMVVALVFDRLADISNQLETAGDKTFTPRLAKSWTWAPDSLSIAFSLDPRARWHDGKPVTASDVRYSFKVFTDTAVASPSASLLANIDSVSVRDSSTAVFWFKKHTPEQFYDVAYQLWVLPEHVYGSIPMAKLRTSDAIRSPIGSGPFRFVRWQPGVRIELEADTANYHGRPPLDRIILNPVGEPSARQAQVLTGQADYMHAFLPDQEEKLDSSKIARPLVVPLLANVFMAMNSYAPKSKRMPHPIFGDIRVRRAISMALDRRAMLQNVFGAMGRIAYGPAPMTLAAASDTTLKLPPYDTTAANALLDSAGWRRDAGRTRAKLGKPLRFDLLVPATSTPRNRYAVLIQEQLRRVGVDVVIKKVDKNTFFSMTVPSDRAADFDAVMHAFNGDPSPSGLKQIWGTAGATPQGLNLLLYSNPKVDALFDSLSASFDPAKVKAYTSRALQLIADDVPAVWLYDQNYVDAVNRRITVGPIRADGWFYTLSTWSIAPDKRIDRDKFGLTPPPKPH